MSKTMAMKAYEVMGKGGFETFLLSLDRDQYEDISGDCDYVLNAEMFDHRAVYMVVGFDSEKVLTASVFNDFGNFQMHNSDVGNSDFEFLRIGRETLGAENLPIGTSYIQKNDAGEVIATGFKFADNDWREAGYGASLYDSRIDLKIKNNNEFSAESMIFLNSDGKELKL